MAARILALFPRSIVIGKVRIIMPWANLGCLAFDCGRIYVDIYRKPGLGLFMNNGNVMMWVSLRSGTIRIEGHAMRTKVFASAR